MFREKYQRKLFSLFSSEGSQPLYGWITREKDGWVRQVKDNDTGSTVLELAGTNVATTHITSPPPPHDCLGLRLPCLTMLVKTSAEPFSFEVQVLDDENIKRRFRFSTYHSATKVSIFVTTMGLSVISGWNVVQVDLAEFMQRAYRTTYMETLKVQIHANCRLRRIFLTDRLYGEDDLPAGYWINFNKKAGEKVKKTYVNTQKPALKKVKIK